MTILRFPHPSGARLSDDSSGPPHAGGLRALLAQDLPASLVVFLVALSLSLGIAVDANVLIYEQIGRAHV